MNEILYGEMGHFICLDNHSPYILKLNIVQHNLSGNTLYKVKKIIIIIQIKSAYQLFKETMSCSMKSTEANAGLNVQIIFIVKRLEFLDCKKLRQNPKNYLGANSYLQ